MLVIEVPEDAKLLINGIETSLTGGVRHFFTSGLADDKRYSYEVSVRSGTAAGAGDQTKTVWLEAGQRQIVSFRAEATPKKNPEEKQPAVSVAAAVDAGAVTTSLTLRVPEDARVWIAGRLTTRTGAVRHFSTRSLAQDQVWEDYEVRVVAAVNGRDEEIVKKLTLTGGRDLELAIDPGLQSARVDSTASLR